MTRPTRACCEFHEVAKINFAQQKIHDKNPNKTLTKKNAVCKRRGGLAKGFIDLFFSPRGSRFPQHSNTVVKGVIFPSGLRVIFPQGLFFPFFLLDEGFLSEVGGSGRHPQRSHGSPRTLRYDLSNRHCLKKQRRPPQDPQFPRNRRVTLLYRITNTQSNPVGDDGS